MASPRCTAAPRPWRSMSIDCASNPSGRRPSATTPRSRLSLRLLAIAAMFALVLAGVGAVLAVRNARAGEERQRSQTRLLAQAAAATSDRYLHDRLDLLASLALAP